MSRFRSRGAESQSVNRRMLLDALIGSDQIDNLAVLNRHLWPESVDNTKLGAGAVELRHIAPEVHDRLGKSTIEHVTLHAVTSQTIAAGGGTVQFDTEADEPTERRGFDTLADELESGAVGDIPCDVTGLVQVIAELQFQDDSTGVALGETGVDCTVTIRRVRDGATADWPDLLEDTDLIGVTGPLTGNVRTGDLLRVILDPSADIKVSGIVYLDVWAEGSPTSAASGWEQVFAGDVWGLTFDGTSWWITEGDSGYTVSQYDSGWTLQSSFEASTFDLTSVRGITWDGTNLWIAGPMSPANDSRVAEYNTSGTLQSSLNTPHDGLLGAAWDGTDLWVIDNFGEDLVRYDTSGTEQESQSLPGGRRGLAFHDGRLYMVDPSAATVEVRETDLTLVDTIDVSGATENPTGVFVASDGTVYVSEDAVGVWRRT